MDILNALVLVRISNNRLLSEGLEIIFDNESSALSYALNNHFSGIVVL